MKILLHICCGPCSIYPVASLREADHQVHGYFFNPNIHPFQEHQRRRQTLADYAQSIDLPVIFDQGYDMEGWLRQVVFRENDRCRVCYTIRLTTAAKIARKGKFDAFTTTLLYSKFQKHELIIDMAQQAAAQAGVDFYYQDFRQGWKQGIEESKERGMYRQQYCGCIYSEKERFFKPGGN